MQGPQATQGLAQVTLQIRGRRPTGGGQRPDNDVDGGREGVEKRGQDVAKPPGGTVPEHRVPDGLGDDEPDAGAALVGWCGSGVGLIEMNHYGAATGAASTLDRPAEVSRRRELVLLRKHRWCELSGQLGAALTATRRDDGATCTGAHTGTEAVHACATTVVRLERPLALCHGCSPCVVTRSPRTGPARPLKFLLQTEMCCVRTDARRVPRPGDPVPTLLSHTSAGAVPCRAHPAV